MSEIKLSPENIDKILNFVYDGDEEKILGIDRLKFRNYINENIKDRYLEVLSYRFIEGLTLEQTGQQIFQSTQPRGLRRQMFTENRRDGTRFYDNLMNLCLEIILRHQK